MDNHIWTFLTIALLSDQAETAHMKALTLGKGIEQTKILSKTSSSQLFSLWTSLHQPKSQYLDITLGNLKSSSDGAHKVIYLCPRQNFQAEPLRRFTVNKTLKLSIGRCNQMRDYEARKARERKLPRVDIPWWVQNLRLLKVQNSHSKLYLASWDPPLCPSHPPPLPSFQEETEWTFTLMTSLISMFPHVTKSDFTNFCSE